MAGIGSQTYCQCGFLLAPLFFSVFEFVHKLEYVKNFFLRVLILVLAKWWFDGIF